MLVNAFHTNCHLGLIHTLRLTKRHVGDMSRQRHVSWHRALVLQRQIGRFRDMSSMSCDMSFDMSCVLSFGASRRHVFKRHCQLSPPIPLMRMPSLGPGRGWIDWVCCFLPFLWCCIIIYMHVWWWIIKPNSLVDDGGRNSLGPWQMTLCGYG